MTLIMMTIMMIMATPRFNPNGDHVTIGRFDELVYRKIPTMDVAAEWIKTISDMQEMKDYEMYIHGSFPHKYAKDIDIRITNPELDQATMADYHDLERIFENGIYSGLMNSGVYFDMSATSYNDSSNYVDRSIDKYIKTGDVTDSKFLKYGNKVIVNGKPDELKNTSTTHFITDQIKEAIRYAPTEKHMKDYLTDYNLYKEKYSNKPILVKERQQIHGII